MTEQKRTFLQETTFEEDVDLSIAPKPPHSTQEMRQRWQENDKKPMNK